MSNWGDSLGDDNQFPNEDSAEYWKARALKAEGDLHECSCEREKMKESRTHGGRPPKTVDADLVANDYHQLITNEKSKTWSWTAIVEELASKFNVGVKKIRAALSEKEISAEVHQGKKE